MTADLTIREWKIGDPLPDIDPVQAVRKQLHENFIKGFYEKLLKPSEYTEDKCKNS